MIIASKIVIQRNIKGFFFPSMLDHDSSIILADELIDTLKTNRKVKLKNKDYEGQLAKVRFSSKDENLNVFVNGKNHVEIENLSYDEKIISIYDEAKKIEESIDKKMPYAFDENFGYLTSSLTKVGTGVIPSFILHIPMLELSSQMPTIKASCERYGLRLTPCFGKESPGGFYELKGILTLGIGEKEAIANLRVTAIKLCEKENDLRNQIYEKESLRLKDEVYRAYGILTNAKLISFKEAQVLLSYVKLGIDMKLFDKDLLTSLKDYHPYKLLNEINDDVIKTKTDKEDTLTIDSLRTERIKETLQKNMEE